MEKLDMYVESFKLKHEAFITGCDSLEEVELWDTQELGEMDAFYNNDLTSIIIRLTATDGVISQREVDYLNEVFAFDYSLDELRELYDNCKENIDRSFDENFENGITYMRKINSGLADAYKELLALVCDIIIASDGVISEAEITEVNRLKAMCG